MPHDHQAIFAQAMAYCRLHTVDWPSGAITRVAGLPDVRLAFAAVDTAMRQPDAERMREACRTWWRAVLAHAPKE